MTGGVLKRRVSSKIWGTVCVVLIASMLSMCNAYADTQAALDWLTSSIDPTREHAVTPVVAWHARMMVVAWGILLPLGVLIARFFKVWPGQKWPQELDRREWWRGHLILQWSGATIAVAGALLILIWSDSTNYSANPFWHSLLGWITLSCLLIQIVGGLVRGTTGGPTRPAADGSIRGDHYDMTRRRKLFEHIHKTIGYMALFSGCVTIVTGLWLLNAPRWMWIIMVSWWLILIGIVAVLQRKSLAIGTYEAIWGPDSCHPGNYHKAMKSRDCRQPE